jgi:hypothetical protein
MKRHSTPRLNRIGTALAVCAALCGGTVLGARPAHTQQTTIQEAVLEDFSDVVTSQDLRTNDFGGDLRLDNAGGVFGTAEYLAKAGGAGALRLDWDFGAAPAADARTGLTFDLFGPSERRVTFNGQAEQTMRFDEHVLNLGRIDGVLRASSRRFSDVRVAVIYRGVAPLTVRLELRDPLGGGRSTRIEVNGQTQRQVLVWDFRNAGLSTPIDGQDLDETSAKTFSVVLEGATRGVPNPALGSLEIQRVFFTGSVPEAEKPLDADLLDLYELRSWQYFLDWSSRKGRSYGIPQASSTTPDELSPAGAGFAIPAWIIAAQRGETEAGWVSRATAAERVRLILEALADPTVFGPEAAGKAGYRGWFYRRLGVDGNRFLRVDDPSTGRDERLETMELAPRDTAVAVLGALAAQSYFTGNTAAEVEIRLLAQQIYDRVDWKFMLEPTTNRFYAGWKPLETRTGEAYGIPDAGGTGHYSGTPGAPETLDAYSDTTYLLGLLAAGSLTFPPSSPKTVHCAWQRVKGPGKFVQSRSGSLEDYELLTAFLDMRKLKTRKCPGDPATWYKNSHSAVAAAVAYAKKNTAAYAGYSDLAYGLAPGPGPDDRWKPYALPVLSMGAVGHEDGTVRYPTTLAVAALGKDLRLRSAAALRAAWRRGHWHYRFGLPAAFNANVAQAGLEVDPDSDHQLLRAEGPWVDRTLEPIGQGLVMLHLENQRSGLIWGLLKKNPNLVQALKRLK